MKSLLSIFLLVSFLTGFAQYQFDNKKAEKLYYKVDDAYFDYDYQFILDKEEEIKSTFLQKEDTVAAVMYSNLAEAYYYELGNLQKALDFYNLELTLREKIQPNETFPDLLFNVSGIQAELGNYSKAESLLQSLLKEDSRKHGKKSEEYYTSAMALADLYITTEQVEKGLKILREIKKNISSNTLEEVGTLKSIGDTYAIQGSYKRAEKTLLEALEVSERNGFETTFEYGASLNSLAILYEDKGKAPLAEEFFQTAIAVFERMGEENEDAVINTESNLARVYFNLGDYEKASKLQRKVAEVNKEYYGEESFAYAIDLLNLARTLQYQGKYAEAEDNYKKCLEAFELSSGTKENLDYGRTESLMAQLYSKLGRIDESIIRAKSAIKTYQKTLGEDNYETAFPYAFLGNAYMSNDQLDEAQEAVEKAYEIRKTRLGKNHPLFAKSSNQMAILQWKKGNLKEAMKYYKETFANYFGQINSYFPVLTEEEKATFFYTNLKPAFEQYVSFIEETSSENKELLGEIYDYQLSLKGLIMYATAKVRSSILASNDSLLIAKYDRWIAQKEQIAKLYSATDIQVEIRNRKIDSLTTTSDLLEEELSKASGVFGKNFSGKKYTWRDVQATLKPGEAAVEMVRYRDFTTDSAGVFSDEAHYAAMIVRHDTEDYPEMVILRNGKDMEKKFLANYRNAIRFKMRENYSYRLFWQPIARKLEGINKIYFAPDGVYNQISIYTLQNPDTKDYLLNEIDLAMVTNTKDLIKNESTYQAGGRSVFFGFPDYNMGSAETQDANSSDNRGSRGVRGSRGSRGSRSNDLTRGGSVPRGVRGNLVRYMRSYNGMNMLPGTKKEVELIDSLYAAKGQEANAYFLKEALETKIKQLESPSILHIATHGFFLELDPEEEQKDKYVENPLLRSGLIMAGANSFIRSGAMTDQHQGDDGILTAYEAMNLNLDQTEVVVLSACETGLGEIKNGEGVYGLQRAFQIAGADAVIMSMWSVDDNATQELMNTFYEEWLSHGDKQKAFNTAQKIIREKYKKPFYWGAFVMVGA
ncbi:MAG: CHAT domain-containing tetratricopeptide repeat protein [Bacteroidota bacterium]